MASLWLASAAFMHAGIDSLGLRYALALPVAYGLYLLRLRLWAHGLARHRGSSGTGDGANLDLPDLQGFDTPTLGGGGDFGGGGASGSRTPGADTAKGWPTRASPKAGWPALCGFLAAWVLSVLLGCGVDHWIPAAQSLPQALRMLHTGR